MTQEKFFEEGNDGEEGAAYQQEPIPKKSSRVRRARRILKRALFAAGLASVAPPSSLRPETPPSVEAFEQDTLLSKQRRAPDARKSFSFGSAETLPEREQAEYLKRLFSSAALFFSKLEQLKTVGIAWDEEEVTVLPRQIALAMRSFPGMNKISSTADSVAASLERECGHRKLRCGSEEGPIDFYEKKLPFARLDFLSHISSDIARALVQKNGIRMRQPRFLHYTYVPGGEDLSVYTTFLDQKDYVMYVEKEPIRPNINGTLSDSVQEALRAIVERIARFRERAGSADVGGTLQEFFTAYSFRPQEASQDSDETDGYHEDEWVCIEARGERFSSAERTILKKMQQRGDSLSFAFQYMNDEHELEPRTLDLSPAHLMELGTLRFRSLDSVMVNGSQQFVLYPRVFEQYENSGVWNTAVYIEAERGEKVMIGNVSLENVEHHALHPYHFYEVRDRDFRTSFAEMYDLTVLREAVMGAEKLFDQAPGTVIKRILADDKNPGTLGSFRFADTLTIVTNREALLSEKKIDVSSVARHEGFHAIDRRYRITQPQYRTPAFDNLMILWSEFPRRLLIPMSDGRLDAYNSSLPLSGAPEENVGEFFASIVNSLFIQQPEKVLGQKDAEFLQWYASALQGILARLYEIPQFHDAPVLGLISERIGYVEKLREEKIRENENPPTD